MGRVDRSESDRTNEGQLGGHFRPYGLAIIFFCLLKIRPFIFGLLLYNHMISSQNRPLAAFFISIIFLY